MSAGRFGARKVEGAALGRYGEQPLRDLLIERGLRLDDVGDAMGVTSQAVTGWTRGFKKPHRLLLPLLCDYLGVEAAEIFTWAEQQSSPAEAELACGDADDQDRFANATLPTAQKGRSRG